MSQNTSIPPAGEESFSNLYTRPAYPSDHLPKLLLYSLSLRNSLERLQNLTFHEQAPANMKQEVAFTALMEFDTAINHIHNHIEYVVIRFADENFKEGYPKRGGRDDFVNDCTDMLLILREVPEVISPVSELQAIQLLASKDAEWYKKRLLKRIDQNKAIATSFEAKITALKEGGKPLATDDLGLPSKPPIDYDTRPRRFHTAFK